MLHSVTSLLHTFTHVTRAAWDYNEDYKHATLPYIGLQGLYICYIVTSVNLCKGTVTCCKCVVTNVNHGL